METKSALKILGVLALFLLVFLGFLFYESQKVENNENLNTAPVKKVQNVTPPEATTTVDLNKEAETRVVTTEEWGAATEDRMNKAEEMLENTAASTTQWTEQKSDRLRKLEALRNPQTE